MARTRNLKPGFFQNERLAALPPLARLLFAGLWTLADRQGRLEDRPDRIKALVLPYDRCEIENLLDKLAGVQDSAGDPEFIIRYSVGSRRFIQVVNFCKHNHPSTREIESVIPPFRGRVLVKEVAGAA